MISAKAHITKPLQGADRMTPIMVLKFNTQERRPSFESMWFFTTGFANKIYSPSFIFLMVFMSSLKGSVLALPFTKKGWKKFVSRKSAS
jgi:hypothetical protein